MDSTKKQVPNMDLAQLVYRFESTGAADEALKQQILSSVREDTMLNYYEHLLSRFPSWTRDEELIASLRTSNEAEVARLDAALVEAEKNAGDMEIMDGLFAKATFFCRVGAKEDAFRALDSIIARKKISPGKKLDAAMDRTRVAMFFADTDSIKESLKIAKKFLDDAGDWDRRNRMRVYEALFLIMQRDLRQASRLLLEGVATFSCNEMCTYQQYIFYVVITNALYLPRAEQKKKVMGSPQVIALARRTPHLPEIIRTLYECEYGRFFEALLGVLPTVNADRYLGPHSAFVVREYRGLAYSQFLEPYRSVTLSAMARAFSVSVPFLDAELSRFVASGRISAKIDKVGDVVETLRPDTKSAQFADVIKRGDALLNDVQRLARVLEA